MYQNQLEERIRGEISLDVNKTQQIHASTGTISDLSIAIMVCYRISSMNEIFLIQHNITTNFSVWETLFYGPILRVIRPVTKQM